MPASSETFTPISEYPQSHEQLLTALNFEYNESQNTSWVIQTVVSLSVPEESLSSTDGLRPVNLRTDLAPLADLIELAFEDSMDSSGRAAVREMRTLSRMGAGLSVLAGVNDLTQGISLGYVWIADGRLVGNVSIYPASWQRELGIAWIIANVAVHPDYRGRGIATRMMHASMEAIRQRGDLAILQVESENWTARNLYRRLGFVEERTWTTWRRSSSLRLPPAFDDRAIYITRRRRGEWRAEYLLAEHVRPMEWGGIGWQRPLHPNLFRPSLWKALTDWFNLRTLERLVIRSADGSHLLACLWLESAFVSNSVQLTLMVEPEYQGLYDDALLNLTVRRYGGRQPLTIEHPTDEMTTSAVLQAYQFRPQRTLVHMRWNAKG